MHQITFTKHAIQNARNYIMMTIISNRISKRNINTKSLSPKLSTITRKSIDLNVPKISPTSDNVNQEISNHAIKQIDDNNLDVPVRIKRRLSDSNSSGENGLKKTKILQENDDNNTIVESIETDTSQQENLVRDLPQNIELYDKIKRQAFKTLDDFYSNFELLGNYLSNTNLHFKEIITSMFNFTNSIEIIDYVHNSLLEPLNSNIPLNEIIYTGHLRFDQFIHSNYSIHMSGIDNIDYRMAYEYLIDSLNDLDNLIQQYDVLEGLERSILPLNIGFNCQTPLISNNITNILELLSQFN
jgi:hypothetical protein